MARFGWLLGAVGLLALAAFGLHIATADMWQTQWEVAGGIGAVLVLLSLWLDREALTRWVLSRGGQYSAMAWALVGVAAGVAVAVNILAQRYDHQVDITASQRFQLADQTVKLLEGLDEDIELHAFFAPGLMERQRLETLLGTMSQHTDKLAVRFHDPVQEPLMAREFDITTELGTVVMTAGDDASQRLESRFDEEALVNALVRLTSGGDHEICFTEGHEELDPDDDTSAVGMGAAIVKLEGQNYTVRKVFPAREGHIPDTCEVVVVADPQMEFLPAEREMLAAHVAAGRALLVMLEPTRTPQLATDLSRYNLAIGDDLILEQNPAYQLQGGDPSYLVLAGESFDFHPITNPVRGAVLLRVVRTVGVLDAEMSGVQVQELAKTSAFAWAETDYMEPADLQPDPGRDRLGPVPVMAVAEITDPEVISVGSTAVLVGGDQPETPPEDADATPEAPTPATPPAVDRSAGGKVVVVGDVDFATNELLDQFNNRDLLLNTLAWLVGEEDQISLRGRDGTGGRFAMTEAQYLIVLLLSLVVVPGMSAIGAVGAWRERRRR